MKSTVVDESLSSFKSMYCSREYQASTRVILDLLASLTVQLQSQTQPTATEEWARMDQEDSYEVALWLACHRALKTTKALHGDLERLESGRRRSWAHSWSQSRSQSRAWSRAHSRTWSRTHSRGQSRDQMRADSWSCHHGDPEGICHQSPDGPPPQRRVSFHNPGNVKDPVKEETSNSMEPSVDDLEMWLEFQAGQLGTPMWWGSWQLCLASKIGINSCRRSGHHSIYLRSA